MELWSLKEKIINKEIPKLLILTGVETTIRDIYIDKIEETLNTNRHNFTNSLELINYFSQKSLWIQNFDLVVIKEDNIIQTEERLWGLLDKLQKNIIITISKIDKKTKFFKRFEYNIVEFDRVEKETLVATVTYMLEKEGINLKPAYIEWLVEACGCDYGRILSELDKLLIFKKEPIDFNLLFKRFATDGVIHYDTPDCLFDFSNAIIARNQKEALSLINDIYSSSNPIAVLAVLYNNIRNLIIVQTSLNPTAEKLGMTPKQLGAIRYKVGKYTSEHLITILATIIELDKKIKLGQIDSNISIEYLLSRIF